VESPITVSSTERKRFRDREVLVLCNCYGSSYRAFTLSYLVEFVCMLVMNADHDACTRCYLNWMVFMYSCTHVRVYVCVLQLAVLLYVYTTILHIYTHILQILINVVIIMYYYTCMACKHACTHTTCGVFGT
jgi:hypothetical protein